MNKIKTLFPVIVKIPEKEASLKGRHLVSALKKYARISLALSAEKSGVTLPAHLEKDENGAPVLLNGIHWSLSHKPEFAAGVVAPARTGIDIEKIRPYSKALEKKTAGPEEWHLKNAETSERFFFRYWTAKESVLKATGKGLKALSSCRVEKIHDERHLTIACMGKNWHIETFYFNDHVASIVKNDYSIVWSVMGSNDY
jgi:4'-phosphopantetheinyl transferase